MNVFAQPYVYVVTRKATLLDQVIVDVQPTYEGALALLDELARDTAQLMRLSWAAREHPLEHRRLEPGAEWARADVFDGERAAVTFRVMVWSIAPGLPTAAAPVLVVERLVGPEAVIAQMFNQPRSVRLVDRPMQWMYAKVKTVPEPGVPGSLADRFWLNVAYPLHVYTTWRCRWRVTWTRKKAEQ